MQKIFNNPAEMEMLAKQKFSIPPFFMMEHAAQAMADWIMQITTACHTTACHTTACHTTTPISKILIVCGKGNNGGDGYALALLLQNKFEVTVVALEEPTAEEAQHQYQKYRATGAQVLNQLPATIETQLIVDCIYGIGFHGQLKENVREVIDRLNTANALRLACDVPSGFYFNADYTITMGQHKLSLFTDQAKATCGQILVADLGIPRQQFEACGTPTAFLVEQADLKLPLRKNKAAHKGTYGHTTVFAGEKSGAAIIAATAAMNFGSGLTTLLTTKQANLEQFKINPELMLTAEIPAKTTCLVVGPGLGTDVAVLEKISNQLMEWATTAKKPSLVFDADMLTWAGLSALLEKLNKIPEIRIVLTPHLSELARFAKVELASLVASADCKLQLGKELNKCYPNTTVIMKSANTFIAFGGETYVVDQGCQSLAKGGSGDVLAGMVGALLAQGYTTKDAAITAVMQHALAARSFGEEAYNLTPFKLIERI